MPKQMQVTSLEAIRDQATPIVELPGWTPEAPFFARVRRVSMLDFVAGGQVPNDLLDTAYQFLNLEKGHNPVAAATEDALKEKDKEKDKEKSADEKRIEFAQLFVLIAKASLVEPTYDDVVSTAGNLTDEQLQALFLYATRGPRALELFRKLPGDNQAVGIHGEDVGQGTE